MEIGIFAFEFVQIENWPGAKEVLIGQFDRPSKLSLTKNWENSISRSLTKKPKFELIANGASSVCTTLSMCHTTALAEWAVIFRIQSALLDVTCDALVNLVNVSSFFSGKDVLPHFTRSGFYPDSYLHVVGCTLCIAHCRLHIASFTELYCGTNHVLTADLPAYLLDIIIIAFVITFNIRTHRSENIGVKNQRT